METPFRADILKGKVALLTGGGSGIGYEISYQLGKHGASVAIMGRRKHVLDSAVSTLCSHGIPVISFPIFMHLFSVFFFMCSGNCFLPGLRRVEGLGLVGNCLKLMNMLEKLSSQYRMKRPRIPL